MNTNTVTGISKCLKLDTFEAKNGPQLMSHFALGDHVFETQMRQKDYGHSITNMSIALKPSTSSTVQA